MCSYVLKWLDPLWSFFLHDALSYAFHSSHSLIFCRSSSYSCLYFWMSSSLMAIILFLCDEGIEVAHFEVKTRTSIEPDWDIELTGFRCTVWDFCKNIKSFSCIYSPHLYNPPRFTQEIPRPEIAQSNVVVSQWNTEGVTTEA